MPARLRSSDEVTNQFENPRKRNKSSPLRIFALHHVDRK